MRSLTTGPPADTSAPERVRYAADILRQERKLSLHRLLEAPLSERHLTVFHGEELSTVAVRDDQLPFRYRMAVSAFRFAQYLRLSWIDTDAVYSAALYQEPDCSAVPDNSVHVITLDRRGGNIVGYVALFGQRSDSGDRLVSDTERPLFPCEMTHGLRVFDRIETEPDLRVGRVWEVKRLVQRAENSASRDRQIDTMLHQFYGVFSALDVIGDGARWLIGDAQEHVAIKQLRMMVRDLTVFEGTTPRLPSENPYWPAYTVRKNVKPFAAKVPAGADMAELLSDVGRALESADLASRLCILRRRTIKDVRRVTL